MNSSRDQDKIAMTRIHQLWTWQQQDQEEQCHVLCVTRYKLRDLILRRYDDDSSAILTDSHWIVLRCAIVLDWINITIVSDRVERGELSALILKSFFLVEEEEEEEDENDDDVLAQIELWGFAMARIQCIRFVKRLLCCCGSPTRKRPKLNGRKRGGRRGGIKAYV